MIIIWPDEKKKTKPSHIIIFPGALYWLFAAVFFFSLFSLANSIFLISAPFVFHSNFLQRIYNKCSFLCTIVSVPGWLFLLDVYSVKRQRKTTTIQPKTSWPLKCCRLLRSVRQCVRRPPSGAGTGRLVEPPSVRLEKENPNCPNTGSSCTVTNLRATCEAICVCVNANKPPAGS